MLISYQLFDLLFFTQTQISYTRNQQSLHSTALNLCSRWLHCVQPRIPSPLTWMRVSISLWSAQKFLLFTYFSPLDQGLFVLGYCPSAHVTSWVLHIAPKFHELAKQTIISSVGCSQRFRLKDLWNNDHPPSLKVSWIALLRVVWRMASNRP